MSIGIIGAPNWVETGWVTFSGALPATWSTGDLANLCTPPFGEQAISNTVTPGYIRADFSALATVLGRNPGASFLMIPKHNLTMAATYVVRAGSAAFNADGTGGGTLALNISGSLFPSVVYPSPIAPWGEASYSGANNPIIDAAYNRPAIVQFPSQVLAKFWAINISDSGNPDGVLKLSRLFLGPSYQPSINWQYGASMDFAGDRVSQVTQSNAEYIDPTRQLKRVWNLSLADLPEDEVWSYFVGLQMYLGYAKQGALIFDPGDVYHMLRRSFMFTILKPGGLVTPYFGGWNAPLQLQEVI